MAPGQVHFVFTLSKLVEDEEELSIGALMQGTAFLSPKCMTRSLHSSWVDRQLQSQRDGASDRCYTTTAMLSAFVFELHRKWRSGQPLPGKPVPQEIFAGMFMAMMYSGPDEERVTRRAQTVIRHYAELHPDEFKQFREAFNEVKAANLSHHDFTQERVDALRCRMKQAVEAMTSLS
jgi:hypothetical protein